LFIAISAIGSWIFACVTPFVAFAVAAACALPTRPAVLTVTAIWLVNQLIGFSILGYAWDANTLFWGIAIGAAAVAAAALACTIVRLVVRNHLVAIGAAFGAALAAYEGGLFLAALVLGGIGAFTPAIVAHVAVLNLGWTVALVGASEILRHFRPACGKPVPPSAALPLLLRALATGLRRDWKTTGRSGLADAS
jgi:hypothetical protein